MSTISRKSTATLTIDGRTYSFGMIPAEESIDVEVAVARVIGEPLFRAFTDKQGTAGLTKEQQDEEAKAAGAAAVGMLMSRMQADELRRTMASVFNYVGCDDKPRLSINDFTGRNRERWQVFIAALKHNYSDFLPASLYASLSITG